MMVGGAILSPLIFLFLYPEDWLYSRFFIYSALLAVVVGYFLYKRAGEPQERITLNLTEGGVIVVVSWVIAIFFSALPFVWGLKMDWTLAVFEAVSGLTTTGLSVMDVEKTPAIYLLWRSIMQMLGGAGLVVIALSSILPTQGMGLYIAEGRTDQLLPHVRRSTKMIVKIYLGYISAGTLLYVVSGMGLFDALNHSMAAISTGGFSTVQDSIGHWNNPSIELVTIVLMFLGTINFATHYTLLQGKIKKFLHNGEIKLMGLLLTILTPIIIFVSLNGVYHSLAASIRYGFFQLVTALSTTGFSTIDFNTWPVFANLIIILLMLIGGGTGSTAGGIKQFRIYLILKSIYWDIKGHFYPRKAIMEEYVWRGEDKWYVKAEHVKEVANYILLYLITYFCGVLVFLAYGYSLQDSLFEFASALGTVGLSVGLTGAGAPYPILWTEIAGMFLGRLEFFVIVYAIIKLIRDSGYLLSKREKKVN
jgi:trk system potassium uptake protein TrkH